MSEQLLNPKHDSLITQIDKSIAKCAKEMGIQGSNTKQILVNAGNNRMELIKKVMDDAAKSDYYGQSKDQFLNNLSNYLKQLGFDIGVKDLKRILEDISILTHQAEQNEEPFYPPIVAAVSHRIPSSFCSTGQTVLYSSSHIKIYRLAV